MTLAYHLPSFIELRLQKPEYTFQIKLMEFYNNFCTCKSTIVYYSPPQSKTHIAHRSFVMQIHHMVRLLSDVTIVYAIMIVYFYILQGFRLVVSVCKK